MLLVTAKLCSLLSFCASNGGKLCDLDAFFMADLLHACDAAEYRIMCCGNQTMTIAAFYPRYKSSAASFGPLAWSTYSYFVHSSRKARVILGKTNFQRWMISSGTNATEVYSTECSHQREQRHYLQILLKGCEGKCENILERFPATTDTHGVNSKTKMNCFEKESIFYNSFSLKSTGGN